VNDEASAALVALVEKVGLLRRDMQQKQDLARYEARLQRVEQKVLALADALAEEEPALADALRGAWKLPARSLAFRNAAHRKRDTPAGD
jgi:hypothetical protein